MIDDYFSIKIDENDNLCTLPLILSGYLPNIMSLPDLIFELEKNIDWLSERKCFQGVGRALARFYGSDVPNDDGWNKVIKSVLYPALKSRFRPPYTLNACYSELTRTSELYKVFERC